MMLLSYSFIHREINPILPFEYLRNAPQARRTQKTPGADPWCVCGVCSPLKGGNRHRLIDRRQAATGQVLGRSLRAGIREIMHVWGLAIGWLLAVKMILTANYSACARTGPKGVMFSLDGEGVGVGGVRGFSWFLGKAMVADYLR